MKRTPSETESGRRTHGARGAQDRTLHLWQVASRPPGGPAGDSDRLILADTHVHLHRSFERDTFFDHAAANLAAAADEVPGAAGTGVAGVLMFTERNGDREFARLREAVGKGGKGRWRAEATAEDRSVVVRAEERPLYIVAGRQVVAREGLETLVLGTCRAYEDGHPFLETLEQVRSEAAAVTVVPWGFGKWWGSREELIAKALDRWGGDLLLGDSGGRVRGAPAPRLMRHAAERSIAVVAGSDPLPLPGQERRPGSYGSVLRAPFDPSCPALSLCEALRALERPSPTFGSRVGPIEFVRAQLALRVSRGRSRVE